MRHKSFDLAIVATCTVVGVILVLIQVSPGVAQVVLSLPLVFVFPGYALTAALFSDKALSFLERIALSLGLSLMVAVLGGFVLNWTPGGLQTTSWAVLLGSITLAASGVALARRAKASGEAVPTTPSHLKLDAGQAVLFGLAVLVVIGAVVVARAGALQHTGGFTQLWMLPVDEAGQKTVRLGVRNMETEAVKYKSEVSIGNDVIREWSAIELQPDQRWETILKLPIGVDRATVQAKLYLPDRPETPYRWVKR